MVRTPSCDKNGLKKGTWTAEEDRKLTAYVTRYGCWNWRQLPKFAGLSRCGKSCRLRWMNYLRPNIKRGNYSKEEEDTIIELHESMGNRWSVIAARLPGRTDNEIKNHWHTNLKKRVEQQNSVPHEEKHSSNNLAPREKRQKRVKQQNNSLLNPTTSQIINSSPSSSSGSSSISKDTAVATSTEAYDETSDSFWTQPFLTDCSFVSSDFLEQPFMDTEYISPVFDEIFCPYGLYEENIITSNNLSPTQNINIDSSPSSPQPSSSEFSSSSGNLWTQPFSADNSFIPNDFLEPFMDTEYLSPVFDEFLCPNEEGLN